MVRASKRKWFTLKESTDISNTSYSQVGVSLLGSVDFQAVWLYDCHCSDLSSVSDLMNCVSALLLHKMKFYADTSVPWEIVARLFLQFQHLLSKTPDHTLVKTHFNWKKKM